MICMNHTVFLSYLHPFKIYAAILSESTFSKSITHEKHYVS